MKRTLILKHESLSDLTSDELADVHGAAIPTLLRVCEWVQVSSPIRCLTRGTTCINCD